VGTPATNDALSSVRKEGNGVIFDNRQKTADENAVLLLIFGFVMGKSRKISGQDGKFLLAKDRSVAPFARNTFQAISSVLDES
jgi:hypothetical protein